MIRTPLKRGTKTLKRSGFKAKPIKPLKKRSRGHFDANSPIQASDSKRKKRTKLPSLTSLRNKCDALLTPLCKKAHSQCEACSAPTQVGHHWIEKSRSSFLRYDLRNLIALCNSCHAKIHNRFGNSVVGGFDVAEIIISKRGRGWKEQLDLDQPKYQKVDRAFFMTNLARLTELLNAE